MRADTSSGLWFPKTFPRNAETRGELECPIPAWFRAHALHRPDVQAEWIDTFRRSFDTDVHEPPEEEAA